MKFMEEIRKGKLEKSDFYNGITFEDKQAKDDITKWILDLQKRKKIKLKKFKYLIWDVVTLPVKIRKDIITDKEVSSVIITDDDGKEFFMQMDRTLEKEREEEYIIGMDINEFNQKMVYKLCSPNRVLKKETFAVIDKAEEVSTSESTYSITHDYESGCSVAIAAVGKETENKKIIIVCREEAEDDMKILKFISHIDIEKYKYNVLEIFIELVKRFDCEDIASVEAYVNDYKYSEVSSSGGIVQRYTYSSYDVSENEHLTHIKTPFLQVDEFLSTYTEQI